MTKGRLDELTTEAASLADDGRREGERWGFTFDASEAETVFVAMQKATDALRAIADPIEYLREEAVKSEATLDGAMASRIADSPHFLRGIAQKALREALS